MSVPATLSAVPVVVAIAVARPGDGHRAAAAGVEAGAAGGDDVEAAAERERAAVADEVDRIGRQVATLPPPAKLAATDEPVMSMPPPLWRPVIVVAPVTVKLPPTPARSIAPPAEPSDLASLRVTLSVPPWSMSTIWPMPELADVGDGERADAAAAVRDVGAAGVADVEARDAVVLGDVDAVAGGRLDGRPQRARGDAGQDLAVEQVDAVRLGIDAGAGRAGRRCRRPAARPACPAPR